MLKTDSLLQNQKVPKDELDKDKYFVFFPVMCLILAFGIPLLTQTTNIPFQIKCLGFSIGVLLTFWFVFAFKNERKISYLTNNNTTDLNDKIINDYFSKHDISLKKYKNHYEANASTLFYKEGLKLIIIPLDQKVAYNISTKGFSLSGGRTPISIGKYLLNKKLKQNLITQ